MRSPHTTTAAPIEAAMAIPAGAYRRIGRHQVVRSEIADDIALAAAADRAGVPVRSLLGVR